MMMKRMMALVLCMMMMASMTNSAFAHKAEGTQQTHSVQTTGSVVHEDLSASVRKFITETGIENEFLVNFEVKTNQNIEQTKGASDAAVVLVIDISSSMNISAKLDENRYSDDRITQARKAAQSFLDSFAEYNKDNAYRKPARYASIVAFDGDAWALPIPMDENNAGEIYWVDVTDDVQLDHAKTEIEKLKRGGGTNTEAGMQIAYNLLKHPKLNGKVADIANQNIIVITDGVPVEFVPNSIKGVPNGGTDPENIQQQIDYFMSDSRTLEQLLCINSTIDPFDKKANPFPNSPQENQVTNTGKTVEATEALYDSD